MTMDINPIPPIIPVTINHQPPAPAAEKTTLDLPVQQPPEPPDDLGVSIDIRA
jgi:hypothetical protein